VRKLDSSIVGLGGCPCSPGGAFPSHLSGRFCCVRVSRGLYSRPASVTGNEFAIENILYALRGSPQRTAWRAEEHACNTVYLLGVRSVH
jgi:hypothetical protein